MARRKPRCRFFLRYLGRIYCREVWTKDIMAPPTELPREGCPAECGAYQADLYDWNGGWGVDSEEADE